MTEADKKLLDFFFFFLTTSNFLEGGGGDENKLLCLKERSVFWFVSFNVQLKGPIWSKKR